MSSQPDHVPHPWRRYLRFSVRGLIVLVLVIGTGLGWVVHEAHVQRDAVAAIVKAGGSVQYDWGWSNGNGIRAAEPWAPRWIVDRIGADYFGHVTNVSFSSSPTRIDAVLNPVARLTRLEVLFLNCPCVSDAALAHLNGLTNLSVLALSGTQVSGEGLAHLKGLSSLSHLDLSNTVVTDSGLVHIGLRPKNWSSRNESLRLT
jgi:hypothetical protein